MSEIIYILTNDAMPNLVKIGQTTQPLKQRIQQLNALTSTPLPFNVHYAAEVADCILAEKYLHEAFGDRRINPKREFFEVAPERVVVACKLVEIRDITPNEDTLEEDEKQIITNNNRRSNFKFKMVNIPLGAELKFIRDTTKKAKVISLDSSQSIEIEEKIMSLSAATAQLLNTKTEVCGTNYWLYEGETLAERRERMENK